MPKTYLEYLNENTHRRFPLMDDATALDVSGSFQLPDALITDIRLAAPKDSRTSGYFYVSRLVVRDQSCDIGIGYRKTSGGLLDIGAFQNVLMGADYESYPLAVVEQTAAADLPFSDMSGVLLSGMPAAAISAPGVWTFNPEATRLNPVATVEGLTDLRSILINGIRYSGNIVLREGANVSITPSYVNGATILTINAAPTTSFGVGVTELNSVDDVLNAVTAKFGQPILTINGAKPNETGNLELIPGDCVSIAPIPAGLKLDNPCGKPCCGPDEIQSSMEAINQLNLDVGRLITFYTQVKAILDDMNNTLVKTEYQTKLF